MAPARNVLTRNRRLSRPFRTEFVSHGAFRAPTDVELAVQDAEWNQSEVVSCLDDELRAVDHGTRRSLAINQANRLSIPGAFEFPLVPERHQLSKHRRFQLLGIHSLKRQLFVLMRSCADSRLSYGLGQGPDDCELCVGK